jgi:adenylate cyclase class IV
VIRVFKEEFEDTKGAIRIRISKKNDRTMAKRKKYKKTNNDLQNVHIKLKIESHEPH